MPEIEDEWDVPEENYKESRIRARKMAKDYEIDEDVDTTMDSLSDAERRGGYGKWTQSSLYGLSPHPMEVGGEYGGLAGYVGKDSPYPEG